MSTLPGEDLMHTRSAVAAVATAAAEGHRFSDDGAVSDHGAGSSPAEAHMAWVAKARCRSINPDELFVRGAAQRKAAAICQHCPVIAECLAEALDNQVEFGVWGGMTERQRRALLKQHPEVVSWSKFLRRPAQAAQHRLTGLTGQMELQS
jgi:WhiB family transcriptional regulator, redox-sensing transcriptional regulator